MENKLIAKNPVAHHNYDIKYTIEAGIELLGTEIKSIRNGKMNLKDSYAIVKNGEVLVRQTGATKIAGPGTYMSRNFTIHAAKDGVVTFVKTKKTHFSGKSLPRVRVEVR